MPCLFNLHAIWSLHKVKIHYQLWLYNCIISLFIITQSNCIYLVKTDLGLKLLLRSCLRKKKIFLYSTTFYISFQKKKYLDQSKKIVSTKEFNMNTSLEWDKGNPVFFFSLVMTLLLRFHLCMIFRCLSVYIWLCLSLCLALFPFVQWICAEFYSAVELRWVECRPFQISDNSQGNWHVVSNAHCSNQQMVLCSIL